MACVPRLSHPVYSLNRCSIYIICAGNRRQPPERYAARTVLTGLRFASILLASMSYSSAPAHGHHILYPILLALAVVSFSASLQAQTFENIPAISVTKVFGGVDPLPQVLTVATAGTSFNYARRVFFTSQSRATSLTGAGHFDFGLPGGSFFDISLSKGRALS